MTNYDLMILSKTGLVKEVDNFLYTDFNEDGSCILCGIKDGRKVSSKLIIPSEIYIDDTLFRVKLISYEVSLPSRVEKLIISEGIEQIDSYSFSNIENLKSVIFPKSLQILDSAAFYNCPKLSEVIIHENTAVGDYCFSRSKWYNNLIISAPPKKLIYIGKTFIGWNGNSVKIAKLNQGTRNINIHPDVKFETLEGIYLPKTIKKVNLNLKDNNIKKLYIEDINSYVSIEYQNKKDSLTNTNSGHFVDIFIGGEKTDSIIIDSPVGEIRKYVLYGANIKNLVIRENIKFLNTNSIDNTPLEYLKLPPKINISGVFRNLLNLKELHIDHSVLFLDSKVFCFLCHDEILTVKIDIDSNLNRESAYGLVLLLKNVGNNKIIIKNYFHGSKKVNANIFIDVFINNLSKFLNKVLISSDLNEAKILLGRDSYKYLDNVEFSVLDLYVPEEDYDDYCKKGWNNIIKYSDNEISYIIDNTTNECKVSCKIDNSGNNSYRGIIRIPKTVIIDGYNYKVVSLDNFAFYDCKCIEKIILPEGIEINPMALLGNEDISIEQYREEDLIE